MARTAPKETVIYEEEEILSIKADTSSPPANLSSMGTPARNIALTPLVTPAPAPTALKPSASILSDTVPAPSVIPAVTPTHNPTGNGSRERTVIREREIVREGPAGRQKEVIFEEETRDSGGVPVGAVAGSIKNAVAADSARRMTMAATTAGGNVIASMPAGGAFSSVPFGSHDGPTQPSTLAQGSLGGIAPTLSAGIADPPYAGESTHLNRAYSFKLISLHTASHISTRINPRTGKPLTIPHALSAQSISPIQTEHGFGDRPSHLIREEHEEVSYTWLRLCTNDSDHLTSER